MGRHGEVSGALCCRHKLAQLPASARPLPHSSAFTPEFLSCWWQPPLAAATAGGSQRLDGRPAQQPSLTFVSCPSRTAKRLGSGPTSLVSSVLEVLPCGSALALNTCAGKGAVDVGGLTELPAWHVRHVWLASDPGDPPLPWRAWPFWAHKGALVLGWRAGLTPLGWLHAAAWGPPSQRGSYHRSPERTMCNESCNGTALLPLIAMLLLKLCFGGELAAMQGRFFSWDPIAAFLVRLVY